jgi:hypothetical protein
LGASHNITSDLANLLVHLEYDGIDEVLLDDAWFRFGCLSHWFFDLTFSQMHIYNT